MIIKSMSRKHRSFSQLFRYMEKGSSQSSEYDFFSKNLYVTNGKDIIAEFSRNAQFLKNRANGNYLFHEVISLTKSKQLTLLEEKERLFDIVRYYTKNRCDKNLVTGFLHDEKLNNIHFHLMISSNELDEHKNQRLTKFEFDKVKKLTEKYVIDKYPELEQDIIINAKKMKRTTKQSNKAGEVRRKGGRLAKKERITAILKEVFSQSRSRNDFFDRLAEQNIELYNRGKVIGFINCNDSKKYRLKTLDLESEFQQVNLLMTQSTNKTEKTTNKDNHTAEPNKAKNTHHENQATDVQIEVDNRKDEIKKSRTSSQSKQKGKKKDKGFDR